VAKFNVIITDTKTRESHTYDTYRSRELANEAAYQLAHHNYGGEVKITVEPAATVSMLPKKLRSKACACKPKSNPAPRKTADPTMHLLCPKCNEVSPHVTAPHGSGPWLYQCTYCGTFKPYGYIQPKGKRQPNPVPPSKHVQIRDAKNLYRNFTGHEPSELVSIDKPIMPDVVSVIGDIDGVLYTTVRDGVTEKYIHKFKKNCRPLFAVSPDGKQLFMLGGSYDFTERGIVDRS
jgi:hypothetical protein